MGRSGEFFDWAMNRVVPGFGPDVNSEGQLGYEVGGWLFSYAEYGSAADVAVNPADGFEQSIHVLNVPGFAPAFELSRTGSEYWQSAGSIETAAGDLAVEVLESNASGAVFGVHVGSDQAGAAIRARGSGGSEIALNGADAQRGMLVGDGSETYATIQPWDTLEPSIVAEKVGYLLAEPGDSAQGYMTSEMTADGERFVYMRAFSDADTGHPLDPNPGSQFALDVDEATYLQRAERAVGDEDFLMRPAVTGEFELPDDGDSGKGDLLPGEAENSGDPENALRSGQGEHPAGDAHRDQIGSDDPPGGTSGSDSGGLAGEDLPSDSTREAMREAWGAPSSPGNDAGSGNDPDSVIIPDAEAPVPGGVDSPQGDFTGGGDWPQPAGDPKIADSGWEVSGDRPAGEAVAPEAPQGADGYYGHYSTTPVDNWGEENEALDGSGTEWPAEENADQGGSELGGAATSAAFNALGQAIATETGVEGTAETMAFSTVIGTLGQNLGQEIGSGTGFEDFGSDLTGNLGNTATGLVAGEVTADLADSLGFDGDSFGDQLGQRMTQYAASSAIEAGVNAVTTGDSLGSSFGESFSGVANVIGGFIGSYLGNEVTEDLDIVETEMAAEMSAVHSSVGGIVGAVVGGAMAGSGFGPIGAAIGAFVGVVVGFIGGALTGNLFGEEPPPPPEAEATLSYSVAEGFQVTDASDANGGNGGRMASMAQQAGEVLNGLLEITGGRLKDSGAVEDLTIGYRGAYMTVNGREVSGQDGVEVLIEEALSGQAIEGGDAFIKRALYRQIEQGEAAPADLVQALATARQYSAAREDAERLDRLREDPTIEAELAALAAGEIEADELSDDALLVHRAEQALADGEALGLDEAHRFDTASRLNDLFAERGIDLEGVSLEDLVVHQQEGRLAVGIRDPQQPDAAVGALPHAAVEAYAGDFDAARLYLGGREHDLAEVLERVGADATTGPVHIGTALADRYAEEDAALHVGTSGRDTLSGNDGADILLGGAGGDALEGGHGDDRLLGGAGADTLAGGDGENTADYGESDGSVAVDLAAGRGMGGHASGDRLQDIEHLAGGGHADELRGDDTANALAGRDGNDRLVGEGGDDTLDGGAGEDIIAGGSGDDRIGGGTGDDTAAGGAGDDFLMGGVGDDRIDGGAGDDNLVAGEGADILAGGAGRDHVEGGAGNDILMGRADGDRLDGDTGEDTAVYAGSWEDYRVDLVDGELQVSAVEGGAPADRLTDIESVAFDEHSFRVEALREILEAQTEVDEDERNRRITGTPAAGATSLGDAAALGVIGWIVADSVMADDTSTAGADAADQAADVVPVMPVSSGGHPVSDPGATTVALEGETVIAGAPSDTDGLVTGDGGGNGGDGGPSGGTGVSAPENVLSSEPIVVPSAVVDAGRAEEARDGDRQESGNTTGSTAADGEDSEAGGIDQGESFVLYGTAGDDELIDYGGRGAVIGLAGDDFIAGLDGDDVLLGGGGDDVILPGSGQDTVDGGEGVDTVSYRDFDGGVTVDVAGGTGIAGPAGDDEFTSIEHAEGSTYADRLIADPRGTRLFGLAGDDVLLGDTGADRLAGGAGSDRLEGMHGNDGLYGDAGADELIGGTGDDVLSGGRGDDRLNGGVGDDTVHGGAGADRLDGGEGNDILDGGIGEDLVLGRTGDDRLAGGEGDDRLESAEGDDLLSGAAGDDRLLGGAGEDRLHGGADDDYLTGGAGIDELSGGNGDDVLAGGKGGDMVYGDAGDDRLSGNEGVDALHAGSGDDVLRGDDDDDLLRGGEGDDRLYGGSGDDDLLGGRGDDILAGGVGADTFNGQSGDDLLRVDADNDLAFVDGGAGRDTVELTEARPGAVDIDTISSVEIARGSNADDTFEGTFALDRIDGGEGEDRVLFNDLSVFDVDAYDWSDDRSELTIRRDDQAVTVAAATIEFAEGDVALGGEDNAPFIAGDSLDELRTDEDVPLQFTRDDLDLRVLDVDTGEMAGSESISAIGGIEIELSRTLGNGYHAGQSDPGQELDTAIGDVASYSIEQRLRGGEYVLFESKFDGTGGDDVLMGSEAFPREIDIDPKSGQAWVTFPAPKGGTTYQAENTDAADGDDVLRAFGGDDILVGGAGSDVLRGGGGDDTADYSRSGGAIDIDLADGYGSGGSASGDTLYSIENLIGTGAGDDLIGNPDENVLEGRMGGDRILGEAGDDRLYGGTGDDVVEGGNGDDHIHGGKGDDAVEGGRGDDRIHGGDGNDVLIGGAGDDVIIGGRGDRDVATFSGSRDEFSIDVISDHMVIENAETGASDRVYGIQELRFDGQSVYVDEVDARNGTLRVGDNRFVFDPDPDFNSLDGATGGFTVAVGGDEAYASTMAAVNVDEVNDAPEPLPDAVDYESTGALKRAEAIRDGLFVRQVGTGKGEVGVKFVPVDPDAMDPDLRADIADAMGSDVAVGDLESGIEYDYQMVDRTGSINFRDPDGPDRDLEFELVDDASPGYVEVDDDGSFRYRLNTGSQQPEWSSYTRSVITQEATLKQPAESRTYRLYHLDNAPEGDPTTRGQQASFTVRITDSGEGDSGPEFIEYQANIVSKHPPGDDGCFPVALDLGDDGLDFRSVDDSDLLADIDGDGEAEQMAWISGDDALLMLDRDGDGQFSDPDEISFIDDHPGARTDMEGLALAFDTNEDGRLDPADKRWKDFHVWQDADGDGESDPGELRTLADEGIESIGVGSNGLEEAAADGDVTVFGRSEFVRSDGTSGTAGDVAFATASAGANGDAMERDTTLSAASEEWIAMLAQRTAQAGAEPAGNGDEESVRVDEAALAAAMSDSDAYDMATESG